MPGKMREAREVFEKCPQPDSCSYNIMLACYLHNFDVDSALDFFHNMPVRDTASWKTMIWGFAQNGKMRRARDLFLVMPEKNSVSWSAMISGYVKCGDLDMVVELFDVASVKSVVAWTAMVTGEMPVKNLVSWNAMISGYVENCRAEEGWKVFRSTIGYGVRPNPSSLSSVLLGCSNLSALQMGKQVHKLSYKFQLYNDTTAGTSLVSTYCKCGNLEDAWKLFVEMEWKDIVTWNAMIAGYAQHGAGLVDPGVQYFDSMGKDYVQAKPDHYTCMVDLLGRAGRIVGAVDLVKKMPLEPHSARS
ncbi:hypothetical protein ACFX14_031878 [Malus domestica]